MRVRDAGGSVERHHREVVQDDAGDGQPGQTELLFFPTDDDQRSPVSAYFSAVDAGADLIIGPLRREWVEELVREAGGRLVDVRQEGSVRRSRVSYFYAAVRD